MITHLNIIPYDVYATIVVYCCTPYGSLTIYMSEGGST